MAHHYKVVYRRQGTDVWQHRVVCAISRSEAMQRICLFENTVHIDFRTCDAELIKNSRYFKERRIH